MGNTELSRVITVCFSVIRLVFRQRKTKRNDIASVNSLRSAQIYNYALCLFYKYKNIQKLIGETVWAEKRT